MNRGLGRHRARLWTRSSRRPFARVAKTSARVGLFRRHKHANQTGGDWTLSRGRFQVSFDNEDPSDDDLDLSPPDHPYLLVQRQFKDDDGGVCYIETLDHDTYTGHFRLRSLSSHPHASP